MYGTLYTMCTKQNVVYSLKECGVKFAHNVKREGNFRPNHARKKVINFLVLI